MLDVLLANSTLPRSAFSLIYNPLNLVEIEQKLLENIEISDKDYFVTVSRLVESKGLLELLDIYAKMKKEGIKNKLYILGDGEQKAELENKIISLSLEEDCFLLGNRTNPYPYIKNAKLFLFTSKSEGLGMVILESMACGVPTVVMDCPSGPKEILGENSQYGKLIPLYNQDAFIGAIQEILDDPVQYQYYQSQGKIRSQDFSENKIMQDISHLFNFILNK